ncbi:MAG: magnesium chelatase subunit D family protein [Thaumarchaeota archaeon]|nr:magnesium chelatase subunit D family protein [Nitrososphaerota archaeon]
MSVQFPLTAIVGQEKVKRALLLNVIYPSIGGVLIQGEKGTAKSTCVRALSAILSDINVMADCPYSCDPEDHDLLCDTCREKLRNDPSPRVIKRQIHIADLPIGATEDRVLGTLDIERAIKKGEKRFEPGILAKANRGILYLDEVNLVGDHLVDVLLDVAASGVNVVEREGVEVKHPSKFILIGTMNPEEGYLRPQLLDRFGLAVEVERILDLSSRREVIERRVQYERDPVSFYEKFRTQQEELKDTVRAAIDLLPDVKMPDQLVGKISEICCEASVAGLRADIIIYKAAIALAALSKRDTVNEDDLWEASELALLHRRRTKENQKRPPPDQNKQAENKDEKGREDSTKPESDPSTESSDEKIVFEGGDPYQVRNISSSKQSDQRTASAGRRSTIEGSDRHGQYIRSSIPTGKISDVAFDATLRAAAPFQTSRSGSLALKIEHQDIRTKIRDVRIGNLILFVLDSSGSMAAYRRMIAVKTAILSLLGDAYRMRDSVALVAFRGAGAELLLSPTRSIAIAEEKLQKLPTGGLTPLAEGLDLSWRIVKEQLGKESKNVPLLVLVTDGKANTSKGNGDALSEVMEVCKRFAHAGVSAIVVDCEVGYIRFGFTHDICDALHGSYYRLEDLKHDELATAVRTRLDETSSARDFK